VIGTLHISLSEVHSAELYRPCGTSRRGRSGRLRSIPTVVWSAAD